MMYRCADEKIFAVYNFIYQNILIILHMHLKFLTVLFLSFLLIGCNKKSDCQSEAELLSTAKPVNFTDKQKSRIPYRNINKITFLLNDTQTVVYSINNHKDYYNLVCKFMGDNLCMECKTKNEKEEHIYFASGFQTIYIIQEFPVPDIRNYQTTNDCNLSVYIGNYGGTYISDYLDSIPFNYKDSLTINNKTYYNIHLVNSYSDSILYTKDFGIIKIIDNNHNKFELIKNE